MKSRFVMVLTTAPNRRTARRIARAALDAKLVACANLVPAVESHYWWQGRIERSGEVLVLFKTTRARVSALERCVVAAHSYDTPAFVVLPIVGGARRYLAWIAASVG